MVLKFPSFAKCCEKKITIGNLINRLKISNNFKNKNKNKLHIYYIINLSNFDFSFPWAIISCFLSLSGRWDFCRVHSWWKNIRQLFKDSWTITWDYICRIIMNKGFYCSRITEERIIFSRIPEQGITWWKISEKRVTEEWIIL